VPWYEGISNQLQNGVCSFIENGFIGFRVNDLSSNLTGYVDLKRSIGIDVIFYNFFVKTHGWIGFVTLDGLPELNVFVTIGAFHIINKLVIVFVSVIKN
jgi:hypothetical protein